MQPANAHLGYHAGDLPVSEEVARQELSLPMYPELTEAQLQTISTALKEIVA